MKPNIETFLGCEAEYKNANIVLFGAPFDSTTSHRPGARFASRAMRADSLAIESYSPYQDKDLYDVSTFDSGDLTLPLGNPEPALAEIERFTGGIISDGKVPLMIGGEHLVSLGMARALIKRHPDLHVIHFDAHADLRNDYLGQKLSHATVMRRIWELTGNNRIHQFGIRSGDREEFMWAAEHVRMHKFGFNGLRETVAGLQGKPVYFTLDLDILDPSILPGTGTPEAGGVTFSQLLEAVLELKGLNIKGLDINELCPPNDLSGVSTLAACKILREIILLFNG